MTAAVLAAVTDLGWSLVGLVVGFLLGVSVRIAAADTNSAADRREWLARIFGVALLTGAVVAGTQVYAAQRQLTQQAECEAAYIEEFNTALTARLEATENERIAQRRLLLGALGPGNSDPAIRDYLAALEDLEQARRDNPLPPRPDCGGDS